MLKNYTKFTSISNIVCIFAPVSKQVAQQGIEIAVRRWASFQQKRTRHFAKGLDCKFTDFLAKLCESKQKIKTI